jgi:hypothetical protein
MLLSHQNFLRQYLTNRKKLCQFFNHQQTWGGGKSHLISRKSDTTFHWFLTYGSPPPIRTPARVVRMHKQVVLWGGGKSLYQYHTSNDNICKQIWTYKCCKHTDNGQDFENNLAFKCTLCYKSYHYACYSNIISPLNDDKCANCIMKKVILQPFFLDSIWLLYN